jgi:phage tail tape-measure protein
MEQQEATMSAPSTAAAKVSERIAGAQRVYSDSVVVGFEQARVAYEKAQQAYAEELQALYAELMERTQQAYRAYSEALSAAVTSAPSYEPCLAEYRGYLERLQQLFGGGDINQKAQAAYTSYLSGLGGEGASAKATEAFRRELEGIWKQEPLRQELEGAQQRYVAHMERLSQETRERQAQAYRDLLSALGDIWSRQDLGARTQGAFNRLVDGLRDVMVQCHAAVEKSSSKAIEALSAEAA